MSWKKNLVMIWCSQFLSIMGFSFAMPFVTFYMQELGVTDESELKMWVALFAAAAPVSMAIFSPIWGAVADRYGRRVMLLRANLGSAILLTLMGIAQSVPILIGLRALQGVMTGTMTAAQAMVAVHTPDHRTGFALGGLSSAVFSGAMAGAALGGVFADAFGYRNAFFMGSGLLIAASLLVVFGTNEDFVRPAAVPDGSGTNRRPGRVGLGAVFPILFVLGAISFARRFDLPFLPLLIQDIHGGVAGASTRTGIVLFFACLAGLLSGVTVGHLADRIDVSRLGWLGALGAGLLVIPQYFVQSLVWLIPARFGMMLCAGGLEPAFLTWLSRSTPSAQRGQIFGWNATARAVGWVLAPLVGGLVARAFGTRMVFVGAGMLFFMLIPTIGLVVRKWGNTNGPGGGPALPSIPSADDCGPS